MITTTALIEKFGTYFVVEDSWSLHEACLDGTETLTLNPLGYAGQDSSSNLPVYKIEGEIDGTPIVGVWHNERAYHDACEDMGIE